MNLEIEFELGDVLGPPLCKIMIDDYIVLYEGRAIPKFQHQFDLTSGFHELKIVHYGKTDKDHVYNMDGSIGIDKYIHINRIVIANVAL